MEIELNLLEEEKRIPPDFSNLSFGRIFTPHMFIMKYDCQRGWHNPKIVPFSNLELHPAAIVLHYAQTIFEGLKAYYGVDGKIRLFRAWDNAERLNRSAERLCIPTIDRDFVVKAIKTFVQVEKDWIPRQKGAALYIRPFIFGTEGSLGVKPSHEYLFVIIGCPVGAYYEEGFNPIKIYVTEDFVRAFPGGTGDVKAGGNYAASLKALEKAKKLGYTQILWLDGIYRRFVEEVGTMNIFFLFEDELATPELTGSILPGITRDSVIKLGQTLGLNVKERRISIDEVIDGILSGRLKECFGTGTAAVISPVGKLYYRGKEYSINEEKTGKIAQLLFEKLTSIQYGEEEDPFGWTLIVEE